MSATEEKGNNNDEETALNEDLVNLNTETRSESVVPDAPFTIPSENIGAMSKIIPQLLKNVTEERIDKEAGDTKVEKVIENLINMDKKNQEPNLLDFGKGSGDHTAISQPDSSTIDKESAIIDKRDEISLMDVSADITDVDDMVLKWDDDDDDESPLNDDILEEQLLQGDSSNAEISKAKDTELSDVNILEKIDEKADNTKDKPETGVIKDIQEINKINLPLQETENIKDTVNIETENNEETAKENTADSPIEDSLEKLAKVIRESSRTTENEVLEVEKEVNKDRSQEDDKKIPEDTNTDFSCFKVSSIDTAEYTKIESNGSNKDELIQEICDNPVTKDILETVETESDVPMDDDDEKNNDCLVKTMMEKKECEIPDPEMEVSMDNVDDVNEDELLEDDENQVLGDDESQDKMDQELIKDNETEVVGGDRPSDDQDKTGDKEPKSDGNQVINDDNQDKIDEQLQKDDESQDKMDQELIKDYENQVVGDDRPSVDDLDKTVDKEPKDDVTQVVHDDNNQDTIDQLQKDDESQDKIGEEISKHDECQDKIGEEISKDDENQVMDIDDSIDEDQNKITDDNDEMTTYLDKPKSSEEDQTKMDDDINPKPTDLEEAVKEQENKTSSTGLVPVSTNEFETIAFDKLEEELISESKPTENIVNDKILDEKDEITTEESNPKTDKKTLTELTTVDILKEIKICNKSEELISSEKTAVEENPDISETVKNVDEEENTNKTENIDNSKVICLDDSPVHLKKAHRLHKPDVMLDIPSQDFIDVDAELSINLDQSAPASPEMMDKSENVDKVEENIKDLVEKLDSQVTKEEKLLENKDKQIIDTIILGEKDKEAKDTIVFDDKVKEIKDTVVLEDKVKEIKDNILLDDKDKEIKDTEVFDDKVKEIKNTDMEDNNAQIKDADKIDKKDEEIKDTTRLAEKDKHIEDSEELVEKDTQIKDTVTLENKDKEIKDTTILTEKDKHIEDSEELVEKDTQIKDTVTLENKDKEIKDTVILVEKDAQMEDAIMLGEKDKEIKDTEILVEKDTQVKDTVILENKDKEVNDTIILGEKDKQIEDTVTLENKDKEIKDSAIKETVEEEMERMFAEDPVVKEMECIASTSTALILPAESNDINQETDSLGLLAESARVRDDEGDAVDDDDFDIYESSNQVSPDQSDDSNAQHSETDAVRDQQEKEIDSPDVKENEFQFTISNVESTSQGVEKIADVVLENVESEVDGAIDGETKASEDLLLKNDDEELNENQNEMSLDQEQQMDIDTVKLSDTSDSEERDQTEQLTQSEMKERDEKTPEREIKTSPTKTPSQSSPYKQSPSKMKKLEIKKLQPNQIVNIVDLQESSSSEDESPQLEPETLEPETIEPSPPPSPDHSVTTVNIPSSIEVMASGEKTSELVSKRGEIVVSGVPKPKPHPPARLNTSEVTIKTVSHAEPMVIPETKMSQLPPETQVKPKMGLEIFNLDSDEEDNVDKEPLLSPKPEVPEKPRRPIKCMNYSCTSGSKVPFVVADGRITAYYETGRKRRVMVCQNCADAVYSRAQDLIAGIKDLKPLVELQPGNQSHELVEISDSESEDDDDLEIVPAEVIGEETAKFLEDNLADMFNETWKKYDLEARLKETQILLEDEMEQLERETRDLDKVFDEYQQATDTLRRELYATFPVQREELPSLTIVDKPGLHVSVICLDLYATFVVQREELPALTIVDKPGLHFVGRETKLLVEPAATGRPDKRRKPVVNEMPAKRPAIPLGYASLDAPKDKAASEIKLEEDKDISVVRLSMELAPADLPPPGTISRPPLRVGMVVYAMRNAFGPWLKGRLLEINPRVANNPNSFSLCRVKFDHKTKTNAKILPARCVAYYEPSDVRMTIGTRLIAIFKDSNKRESFYSGVVAEIPNPVNSYRYLVFFDDGYAQYVHHPYTRVVCESSPLVWEEVHPFSREFVMDYLLKYPERPMVRLHEGQHLKTEWNGKWWSSRVSRVDASLAQVMFVGDGRREWIYRGSTRLAPLYLALKAAERHRPRPMPRSKAQPGSNMPYVEYTRSDEPTAPAETKKQPEAPVEQQTEEVRHQRAVAKKSTVSHVPPPRQEVPKISNDAPTKESRVVYYTPKNAVRPYKMTPHRCGPQCKRSDVLTLKELRTYNPLAKPLLSGWERQLVRFKGQREVMYRAPCGRRLRNMGELHHYLRLIDCELPVDLFDFNPMTHCLAEFVMHKCLVGKKDLSHGKENVPVPCVNFFDESLPEFCSYNTERTPTAGVPLNLDPEFLCGCDCTDDCADKEKCACWRMTLEGAKTIGLEGPSVGYVYKRLPEPLPSGIYECNSRCKCKDTCLNRVAQHPLQLKLQVFKTENRGWGIRALNDVPKGSFLCVYAGNLLTDATANLDGLNEGDEYLAELDYIEVVEQMKEGYEEDIPEADKKLDKKEKTEDDEEEESESSSSEEDDTASKTDKEDDDFRPGYIGLGVMEFNKRLRRRSSKKVKEEPTEDKESSDKSQEKKEEKSQEKKEANADEDCITISDDEEVREPSSFTVKAGMGANDFVSKYRSVRSYFGEDEACYIMDAKVQGNIGRYLNHSCCPNVFVQNVFVDTHDPRFPWVAFFALSHIKAGTELTWNYNYDVGSVPGKVLYCYCDAPNCRGRLL